MISISNVSKSYGSLDVLHRIDLEIPQGCIFGLVGRSGVGKSTLLRCINGLETYNTGAITVGGTDVGLLNNQALRQFRREVGMVFQNFSLVTRDTVYNNVALPMKCWGYDRNGIKNRVKELLELVGIPEKIYCKARELSGGQKQRVAVARALAMNPKVLLCDEATSALDPKSTLSILELLSNVNQKLGITVVMVTHEMQVVKNVCQRMAIMEGGVVMAEGAVRDIFIENPTCLQNLLGKEARELPESGVNLTISYAREGKDAQLISQLARELSMDFTVLGEPQQALREGTLCTLTINIAENDAERVLQYLENRGVYHRFADECQPGVEEANT